MNPAAEFQESARPPRVSVIMTFLNGERFMAEAIDSVIGQTMHDWELILVDDGSVDSSLAIASSFISRFPGRIRLLAHPGNVNRGIAASRNLGMAEARGDYIALLDADDVYEPRRLECHVNVLDADPGLGVVLSRERYWHSWASGVAPGDRIFDQVIGPAVEPRRRFEPPCLIVSTLITRGAPMPSPCSVTFRREAIRAVGGIPEEFRGHYEDQALFCKLLLSYPVVVLPEALARYRQNPESVTSGNSALENLPGSPAMLSRGRFLRWLQGYLPLGAFDLPELEGWIVSELAKLEAPAPVGDHRVAGARRERVLTALRRSLPESAACRLSRYRHEFEAWRVRRRVMRCIAGFERARRLRGVAVDGQVIRNYWNDRIHDTPLSDDPPGTRAFYAALDRYHLQKCDYLLRAVDFGRWASRDVLEIGCGAGLDLVRFAAAGAHITGVDVSRTAIELTGDYCRAAGVEARLIEADGARLPFAAGSFDLVYCMGVLPFAADPAAIVAEAHRMLRPGGEAIFMVYNRRSWMNLVMRVTGRDYGHTDAPGFTLYRLADLERLLPAFPERRFQFERFPWRVRDGGGMVATMNKALTAVLRPYGWHLLAFCRRAS
jgi:SAM-dependent methyltransferase/GT2 family glycosyltransferase